MERTGRIMWTLDFLDDLDADFRAFYRIDGIGDGRFPPDLSAPRFFALARRCSAYMGAMAAALSEEERQKPTLATQPRPAQAVTRKGQQVEMVASDGQTLATHPALAGVMGYSTSEGGDRQ